jgi:hypothetical protein
MALRAIYIARRIQDNPELLLSLDHRIRAEAPVFIAGRRPCLHPQATLTRAPVTNRRGGNWLIGATQDHAVTLLDPSDMWRKSLFIDAEILD